MISRTTQQPATQHQVLVEAIPSMWVDERDDVFFRMTASLFPADFVYGAGVLLASYDAD